MTLQKMYENAKPCGTYCICNVGGILFYPIDERDDTDAEYVTAYAFHDKITRYRHSKVYYTPGGRAYVNRGGKIYLDEVMRA